MTLIEISARDWALGSSEVQCREGGMLPECVHQPLKQTVSSLRKPKSLISSPKVPGDFNILYLQSQLATPHSNHWITERNCSHQHTQIWFGQSSSWTESGGERLIQRKISYGRKQASVQGWWHLPRGRQGCKVRAACPAPPDMGCLQSFQDPLWPGMWHYDLTFLGQPTRQGDDVDCHVPHVNSAISP